MNLSQHIHTCFECHKEYTCSNPECIELKGEQGICQRCSYLHGWAQAKDRRWLDDF